MRTCFTWLQNRISLAPNRFLAFLADSPHSHTLVLPSISSLPFFAFQVAKTLLIFDHLTVRRHFWRLPYRGKDRPQYRFAFNEHTFATAGHVETCAFECI